MSLKRHKPDSCRDEATAYLDKRLILVKAIQSKKPIISLRSYNLGLENFNLAFLNRSKLTSKENESLTNTCESCHNVMKPDPYRFGPVQGNAWSCECNPSFKLPATSSLSFSRDVEDISDKKRLGRDLEFFTNLEGHSRDFYAYFQTYRTIPGNEMVISEQYFNVCPHCISLDGNAVLTEVKQFQLPSHAKSTHLAFRCACMAATCLKIWDPLGRFDVSTSTFQPWIKIVDEAHVKNYREKAPKTLQGWDVIIPSVENIIVPALDGDENLIFKCPIDSDGDEIRWDNWPIKLCRQYLGLGSAPSSPAVTIARLPRLPRLPNPCFSPPTPGKPVRRTQTSERCPIPTEYERLSKLQLKNNYK